MAVSKNTNKNNLIEKLFLTSLGMVISVLLFGCSARYGSLQLDTQVQEEFESNSVSKEYKYYYYGFSTAPYVILHKN